MNVLIRNGKVINADNESYQDIRCADGRITEIGTRLKAYEGERVLDAARCYLLPGGVDPHVHMALPTACGTSSDDFYSGSIAALAGGTTTIIDFVTPESGQLLSDAISSRRKEAGKSIIDHTFHVSPIEWRTGMDQEIIDCVKVEGLRSFKAYMAYKSTIGLDDETLLKVMNIIALENGVLAVHCELGDEIERMREKFAEQGKLSPRFHGLSRPPELEAAAAGKLVRMVERTGCAVYIVHVSSVLTLEVIRKARHKKLPVYAETCPQYLLLDMSQLDQEAEEAVKYIMSPPLRTESDNRALWDALADGTIQTVGTDHCPFLLQQKLEGGNDFRKIPGGVGGVEHRLSLLYTYGVLKGRISLTQFVDLVATKPAEIFGLFPKKGVIAVGSDADIIIWDPDVKTTISARDHQQNCDYNIYEGIEVYGKPKWVIAGGEILADQGFLKTTNVRGSFLKTNSS
jgi:dihydropyrimidinase